MGCMAAECFASLSMSGKIQLINSSIPIYKLVNANKNTKFVQIESMIYNMHKYIDRQIEDFVKENRQIFPAVLITGPRQSGKSTFVKKLAKEIDAFVYLDLQDRNDLAKLTEPGLFLETNKEKTICLDEIQLMPDLFSILRSEIDKNRRNGRFILLGSASRDLIQRSSESLAGRIGVVELTPFTLPELQKESDFDVKRFWLRGGYPESYLARSDSASAIWRENFLQTYTERDIPQLGFQIPAIQINRMLQMCAHVHAQIFNASKLGESLGLTHPTVKRYLDLLEQTFILRSLQPYEANTKKRLVKSPKVYFRDSGLLHKIMQLGDFNDLMGHPVFGSSWEGLVVENIITCFPKWKYSFYRSATGDEIDLIMQKNRITIAIECKASTAPKLNKGFIRASDIIKPSHTYVIAPVKEKYPIKKDTCVCGLMDAIEMIRKQT